MSKIMMVCSHLGSDNVTRDALACWSVPDQCWEISAELDDTDCENCGTSRWLDEQDVTEESENLPFWTVMLLYPNDGNGVSTWLESVRAASAADAERIAQETVHKDNSGAGWDDDPEDRPDTQPADYLCLMVLAGEHSDVRVPKTYSALSVPENPPEANSLRIEP